MVINRSINVGVGSISKLGIYPAFIMSISSCGGTATKQGGDETINSVDLNSKIADKQRQIDDVNKSISRVHDKINTPHTCAVPAEIPKTTIEEMVKDALAKHPSTNNNESVLAMEKTIKELNKNLTQLEKETSTLKNEHSKFPGNLAELLKQTDEKVKKISEELGNQTVDEITESLNVANETIKKLEEKFKALEQTPTSDSGYSQGEKDRLKRARESCSKITIVKNNIVSVERVIEFLGSDVEQILDPRFNVDLNIMTNTFEASTSNILNQPMYLFAEDYKNDRKIYKISKFDFTGGSFYTQTKDDKENLKFTLVFLEGEELSFKNGKVIWSKITDDNLKKLKIDKKCKILC